VSAGGGERFELARMSGVIQVLTVGLLALPPVLLLVALMTERPLAAAAVLMAGVYAWVWLRFRPTAFVVRQDALDVIWPLRQRRLPRAAISDVQLIDRRELKRRIGLAVRVGAGGLWGGFGSLWTQRRGVVKMYISRVDRFVWIELSDGPPWLITPNRPDAFVRAMRHTSN
jgi:hypothetical protein